MTTKNSDTIFLNSSDIFSPSDKNLPNVEQYYLIFEEIKKLHITNGIQRVKVIFLDDIEYIHPLFVISIYTYYEYLVKNNETIKKVMFYVGELEKYAQYRFLHLFTQYIDYSIAGKYNLFKNKAINLNDISVDSLHDPFILLYYNTPQNLKDKKERIAKEGIHNSITLNDDRHYKTLPITKLTQLTTFDIFKDIGDNDQTGFNYQERKYFYIAQQLDKPKGSNHSLDKEKEIWNKIFTQYLEINFNDKKTLNSFQNLLEECKSNIRVHTQKGNNPANGYISFYRNAQTKRNEFIICDDYETGFLKSYLYTLKCERIRIKKLHNNRAINHDKELYNEIITQYTNTINDLNNRENEKVLNKMFNINSTYDIHQAGRIIMHFGIPTLIKLVNKLNENLTTDKATLNMYVHHEESYYHIKQNNQGVYNANKLNGKSAKGTYIYLSFPFKTKIGNIEKTDNTIAHEHINLNTSDYFSLFNKTNVKGSLTTYNYESIQNNLALFKKVDLKDINNNYFYKLTDRAIKHILISYDNKFNISDFLRTIFRFTYNNDILDLVIVNFPIEKYKTYLSILIDILYPDDKKVYKNTVLNILFLDSKYPKAVFIGGTTKNTLLNINKLIYNNYNESDDNILELKLDNIVSLEDTYLTTNIFIKTGISYQLLPFELYTDADTAIYSKMIDNTLESNALNIHVQTNSNLAIKKFYLFKHIFEDTAWLNILACDMTQKILKDDRYRKNINTIIFVGIGKYSSLLLSIVKNNLSNINQSFIIEDINNDKIKDIFQTFKKNNQDKIFLYFTPILNSGKKLNQFLQLKKDINLYCAIQLEYEGSTCSIQNPISLITKDINDIILKNENISQDDSYTKYKNPIYEIITDQYNIKELSIDDNENFSIDIKKYEEITKEDIKKKFLEKIKNIKIISWKNSIIAGHTTRASKHFLYYTKSIPFFDANKEEIINEFDKDNWEKKHFPINKNRIPIILASAHETNSDLISLINKNLFSSQAKAYIFDLEHSDNNTFKLKQLEDKYKKSNNCDFYFVDDGISSSNTLEYIHTILLQISKEKRFKSIFTLINRASKKENDFFKTKYTQYTYEYKLLNIRPIKMNFEQCYLCQREDYFKELINQSSLIFIKYQLIQKKKKLECIPSSNLEYDDIVDIDDLKSYLKMSAVEFIQNNLNLFKYQRISNNRADNIKLNIKFLDALIEIFQEKSQKYFYKYNVVDIKTHDKIIIDTFLNFNAKIALIKSLAFPKILYIQSIRKNIHNYLINEIDISTKICIIKPILTDKQIDTLKQLNKKNHTLNNIYTYYIDNNKNNIDYFNFLVLTAAYLKIDYILNTDIIHFFHKISKKIRFEEEDKYEKSLLHKYPIAVKMCTSYSVKYSEYFNKQYSKFRSNIKKQYSKFRSNIKKPKHYTRSDSLTFSLIVENSKYKEEYIKIFTDKLQNEDSLRCKEEEKKLDCKINVLKNTIKEILEISYNRSITINNISFFANVNKSLSKIHLVDIFDGYKQFTPEKHSKNITLLFNGAKSDPEVDNETDRIRLIEQNMQNENTKYDLWCNYYVKTAINPNEYDTYIRVTKLKGENLIPIGVFIISHGEYGKSKKGFYEHINISRIMLMLQNEIINYVENNNLISIDKYMLKRDSDIREFLSENIAHTDKPIYHKTSYYIKDKLEEENLNTLHAYTASTLYGGVLNFLKEDKSYSATDENSKRTSLHYALNDSFIEEVNNYLESKNIIEKKNKLQKITLISHIPSGIFLNIPNNVLQSIFFELSVNVFKNIMPSEEECFIHIIYDNKEESLYIVNDSTETPTDISKIFDKGYSDVKTTGAGLYLIKQKLAQHQYRITYEVYLPFYFNITKHTFILKIKPEKSNVKTATY